MFSLGVIAGHEFIKVVYLRPFRLFVGCLQTVCRLFVDSLMRSCVVYFKCGYLSVFSAKIAAR